MRYVLFLLLVVSFGVTADDFRGLRWGVDMRDVLRSEPEAPISQSHDTLVFDGRLADIDVNIVYVFDALKLATGGYLSKEVHTNKNLYIDDYEQIKGLLIQKYGEPDQDRTTWHSDLYRDKPEDYGLAISIGAMVVSASWTVGETRIVTGLTGEGFKIKHSVLYIDIKTDEQRKAKERAEAYNQL